MKQYPHVIVFREVASTGQREGIALNQSVSQEAAFDRIGLLVQFYV